MSTNNTRPPKPSMGIGNAKLAVPRPSGPKFQPSDPNSARALALLMQQPVTATPVPRVHVGQRRADGSITVHDRATDRAFLVYTPRRDSEFRTGHRTGLWYVRAASGGEASPTSPGFRTAIEGIEAIRSPRVPAIEAPGHRPRYRVLWS